MAGKGTRSRREGEEGRCEGESEKDRADAVAGNGTKLTGRPRGLIAATAARECTAGAF